MQMQMTEKDKKLIVFLAIFVIVVAGGYWGLYPIISKISSINSDIDEAMATRDMNEIKVAQVLMLEEENEEMESDIKISREQFFPVMTSSQVDKYITGLILDYKLTAYDLSIDMPKEEAEVEPYIYSEKAVAEDEAATEDAENTYETVPTGIYEVSVTMRVGGDRKNIQQLIDDLSGVTGKIHLTSFSWGEERSVDFDEDGAYEVKTNVTMTISLNLYMCEE